MEEIRLSPLLSYFIDLIQNNAYPRNVIRSINNNPEILKELQSLTGIEANKFIRLSTARSLWHVIHNNYEMPLCECGKMRQFKDMKFGYLLTCGDKKCRYEKRKNTCIQRFGVENPLQNIDIMNKMMQTNVKKRGTAYTWQSKEVKEKCKETMIMRYEVDCFLKIPNIRKKAISQLIKNNQNKYGVDHISQSDKFPDKQFKRKKFIFPSGKAVLIQGYEDLALTELLTIYNENDIYVQSSISEIIDKIWWTDSKDIKHRYFPDIFIKSCNKIIEVKSEWTYSSDKYKKHA